jgi:hypothetical protein
MGVTPDDASLYRSKRNFADFSEGTGTTGRRFHYEVESELLEGELKSRFNRS